MGSPVNFNNYIYSTNKGLYAQNLMDVVRNPEIYRWADDYADPHKDLLPYDDYFGQDLAISPYKISPQNPVTIACLSAVDPKTNRGVIGLLNDSSGGTAAGNEFKSRLAKALASELEKAQINAAIYDNRVEFILMMEGNVDRKTMSSVFEKAIGQVNPEIRTILNGKCETVKFFEKAKAPPEIKYGYFNLNNDKIIYKAGEIKATTDKLFEMVKSKQYGAYDFKELLDNIKSSEPYRIKEVKSVQPKWKLVESNWNHYRFAFYDCNELMPDDLAERMKSSIDNYGIEIDGETKEYLLLKNRQLFVNEPTGALNKTAYDKLAGKLLAGKPANAWIAGGDIYNVGGLNKMLGRAVTDNYLKSFSDTWKRVAGLFDVHMDLFRIGGDEIAYIIRDADAETVVRMNMAFNRLMNEQKVLPDELIPKIGNEELGLLARAGMMEKVPGGKMVSRGVTWAEVERSYEKISGVITKGSQQSFFAEKISPNERRLDPEHFKEFVIAKASEYANKVYSETAAVIKRDNGYVVMEPNGMKYYEDYSVHKMNLSEANKNAVKKIIVNDPKARLISQNISEDLRTEKYKLSNGREIEIRTEIFRDRIEMQTGGSMIKLKKAADAASSRVNIEKLLFKKPGDIYVYIDEMKKNGWSDSQILEDAIKRSETALRAKDLEQAKLLNKLGRAASPLGVAAVLYGIHMINAAPVEKRAELFAGFISGFGGFALGMKLGYKISKGSPLLRAGAGFILGSAFAVMGDGATRKLIGSIDKVKEVFEKSEVSLALMYALEVSTDPMIYLGAMEDTVFGTEYQKRNAYVAQHGPDGWDAKINVQMEPLKEKLDIIAKRISDPDAVVNSYMNENKVSDAAKIDGKGLEKYFKGLIKEYSALVSKIKVLESQKYNIKREDYGTDREYHEALDAIKRGSATGQTQPIKG